MWYNFLKLISHVIKVYIGVSFTIQNRQCSHQTNFRKNLMLLSMKNKKVLKLQKTLQNNIYMIIRPW